VWSENADSVTLAGLGPRVGERFAYEYTFFANLCSWRHDLRLQAIEPARPHRRYPRCSAGARSAPPEECGGPEAFLALRQEHSAWAATVRLAEVVHLLLEAPSGQTVRQVLGEEVLEELPRLLYWRRIDTFDKAALNQALAALTRKDTL
jgi:hypothetical protein